MGEGVEQGVPREPCGEEVWLGPGLGLGLGLVPGEPCGEKGL